MLRVRDKVKSGPLGVYLDAAKNMRTRQLVHRFRRAVPMRALAVGIQPSQPPGWLPAAAGAGVEPAPSSGPTESPHVGRVFRAVGARRWTDHQRFWTDRADGLLFLFHLHGFSDLSRYVAGPAVADGDLFWRDVIADWLARCARPAQPAWHPYPMSGRVIAWCAALSREGWPEALREPMLANLWTQLRLLRRSVEHDIGGNHVLRNAAALAIGGTCLEHPGTADRGLRLLERELHRQVLPDGGQEERSPSYQRAILADLADVERVVRTAGGRPASWLLEAQARMTGWLEAMRGPAGDLPALNDGWDGPPLAPRGTRSSVEDLAATGYIVLRERDSQMIFDAGPVSPQHLPAHAHADVLSVVLWASGEAILVDSGTGSYSGPDRTRFRSTAAHNTVEIDGEDQCELWGDFRAAYLPVVQRNDVRQLADGLTLVRARHDGYRRLADPVEHERTLLWLGDSGVVLVDRLESARPHTAASRLHFAEGIADPLGELPGGLEVRPLGAGGAVVARKGRRAPYLGSTLPIQVLERVGQVAPGDPFGWAITRPEVEVALESRRLLVRMGSGRTTVVDLD